MLIVGLTGGIGSGKSTVADLFAEHGVPVIDTDVIARELVTPKQAAYSAIIEHFKDIALTDRTIDRAKLRKIVFEHPEERRWLENLLHPLIRAEVEKRISQLDASYCLVVIPLLFEVGPYPFLNRILVVDAEEKTQIGRVIARDKIEHSHAESILKTQFDRAARLTKADDIIINDGSIRDLYPQVEKLHQFYLQLADQR